MIGKRNLLIIDAILLFGILISIFFLVGYTQPLAIAPLPSDSSYLLFYLPKTDFVLIDDNSRFDSPETIFIGDRFELKSGRYFIKFHDGLKGEIRQVDVEIDVVLELKIIENELGVFNTGKTALNIETYDKGSLIDSSIVYAGSSENGRGG